MDEVTTKVDAETFVMLWLYGPAGTGKPAISCSVAQLCEVQDLLLASFSFFRKDSRRNTMELLTANLAYRIACMVPSTQSHIEAVVKANPRYLLPSILIASRPELHIQTSFSNNLPVLHLVHNDDFHLLQDKFHEIRASHMQIPSGWPSMTVLDTLFGKASSQFVYASLAARFLNSPRHSPIQLLEILPDLSPLSSCDLAIAEVDNPYAWLLSLACRS